MSVPLINDNKPLPDIGPARSIVEGLKYPVDVMWNASAEERAKAAEFARKEGRPLRIIRIDAKLNPRDQKYLTLWDVVKSLWTKLF